MATILAYCAVRVGEVMADGIVEEFGRIAKDLVSEAWFGCSRFV
jgi:hypothetical protein